MSDLATPRTVAFQAPPSMGFSSQEYWNGLPLPSPKNNLEGKFSFLSSNYLDGKFSFLSSIANVLRQEVEIYTVARLPSKFLSLRAATRVFPRAPDVQRRERESRITVSWLAHGVEQTTPRTCSPVSILAFSFTGSFSCMVWHIKLKQ